jgi:3-dehydrosphinganine reductase
MGTFSKKIALITGGSSGIGLALAKKMAAAGANIAIVARRPDGLQIASQEILNVRSDTDCFVEPIQGDVSDCEKITSILEDFVARRGAPDYLINSAGIARPGQFEDLPIDLFSAMMNINYLGTVYPTRAVIGSMIKRRSGHVINISSMAGYLGVYGYTAYGASKFAVRGFSDVLRAEMKPHGIRVSLVFPPDTKTPQLEYESQFKPEVTKALSGTSGVLSAEAVAESILRGIHRSKYIITPGLESTAFYHLSNLIGVLVYPLMDSLISQALHQTHSTGSQPGD